MVDKLPFAGQPLGEMLAACACSEYPGRAVVKKATTTEGKAFDARELQQTGCLTSRLSKLAGRGVFSRTRLRANPRAWILKQFALVTSAARADGRNTVVAASAQQRCNIVPRQHERWLPVLQFLRPTKSGRLSENPHAQPRRRGEGSVVSFLPILTLQSSRTGSRNLRTDKIRMVLFLKGEGNVSFQVGSP